jgi:hypothetical protein
MHIIRIDETFLTGLAKCGMHHMWIQIDDEGFVERELGFDNEGEIVHRYPRNGPYGDYGVFEMNKFDVPSLTDNDITSAEFEKAWNYVDGKGNGKFR